MKNSRPKICEKGSVFYITHAFPPVPSGSSIINRNLLSAFDCSSFTLFTENSNPNAKVDLIDNVNIQHVFRTFYISSRLNIFLGEFQVRRAVRKILKYAKNHKPEVIVGVYPNYYFMKIARDVAKALQIPLVAYIHDTIAESRVNTRHEREAEILQKQVFNEASILFVMSDGIRELYKKKYNLDSISLQHTYLEEIPSKPENRNLNKEAFWGGYIYGINSNSVRRMYNALRNLKVKLFLATSSKKAHLEEMGIDPANVEIGFYSNRKEYLARLKECGVLLLALDWPDESKTHVDELSTIFPTKTPEYLATGNPILVHCPEDYFLAKFFIANDCGIVITERDEDLLMDACKKILYSPNEMLQMRENALKAAKIFESELLTKRFKVFIDKVSSLGWGEKIQI